MQKLIKNLNLIWNKFKKNNLQFWDELEEQFILNDVSALTTERIITDIKNQTQQNNITDPDKINELLKNEIAEILSPDDGLQPANNEYDTENVCPRVWMIVGVNGVGKTSSIAKLANHFKKMGKTVLLTSADTYRAAAYEQLNHFAQVLNLPIVHHQRFSDPGAVVYDSIEKAIAKNIDIILIDTAGRMHTEYNLMEELKKVKKVILKKIGRQPDEILMVIDSTTGQNAKTQAGTFHEALNLSGLILTKTDGTSKGGIVLTIKNELKIPVRFMTSGEKLENLEIFDPVKFTGMLFS